MKLSKRILTTLAEMICGDLPGGRFPYRSSTYLTEFFRNCDMDYTHDGSTRKWWVVGVLEELNQAASSNPHMPSDGLVRVIRELLDPTDFQRHEKDRPAALAQLNEYLSRDGLEAFLDGSGSCQLKNTDSQVTSAATSLQKRTWTKEELARRALLSRYLDEHSEDDLIANVLVPIFSQLGFRRISVAGHKDKSLEYGKDVWMKFVLPTGHVLYFGLQVKKGKIDATAKSKNENVAEVLNQILMMLAHPIWDPDINKQTLLDHVFVVSGGDITKQAKNWLGQKLDTDSRRHVIFMDRDEILDLALGVNLRLPADSDATEPDDPLPF